MVSCVHHNCFSTPGLGLNAVSDALLRGDVGDDGHVSLIAAYMRRTWRTGCSYRERRNCKYTAAEEGVDGELDAGCHYNAGRLDLGVAADQSNSLPTRETQFSQTTALLTGQAQGLG